MKKIRPIVVVLALIVFSLQVSVPAAATKQVGSSQSLIYYSWKNVNSGQCLSISGGVLTNGTHIIQWPCPDNDISNDQLWEAVGLNDGSYYLFRSGANHNKCLADPGSSLTPGTQMIIFDCNYLQADQYWKVDVPPDLHNGWRIRNLRSNLVLAVANHSLSPGAAVIQFSDSSNTDKRWY
jgi:hypothetical protein